jgi:chromosome segregation ATPase
MTRNNKRNRSVLEGNNEKDLLAMIATISVKITNQKKVLEDARDAPAEIQLSLQKQLNDLHTQLNDLHTQLNDLHTQLNDLHTQLLDAYEVEIEGKIIYTQLSAIICICRHKNTLTCTSIITIAPFLSSSSSFAT